MDSKRPGCLCDVPEAAGYACPVHGRYSALLVSETDLVALTGARRASAQVRWLQERQWTFELTIDGRPVVAVAEFEAQMCTAGERSEARLGPNLAALDRVG